MQVFHIDVSLRENGVHMQVEAFFTLHLHSFTKDPDNRDWLLQTHRSEYIGQ